ncbi:7327_t:CDS:1 [Rhizophagus irregularis]|nr:7327_t:CDS:1 [Rhizophagus irregularis]
MAISPLTNSFSRTLFSFIPTTSPRPTKKSLKGPVIQYSMRLFLTCCIRDRVDDRVLKEMIRKIPNTKVLSVEHADINAVTRKEIHKTARMIRRAEDHILYGQQQFKKTRAIPSGTGLCPHYLLAWDSLIHRLHYS